MVEFDISELENYTNHALRAVEQSLPKECKKFIRTEGNKLKKATKAKAKQRVKKKTGAYHSSIKRGKVYLYSGNGGISVRVYAGKSSQNKKTAHHAHLLEYGHRLVKNDREIGFVRGYHVFGDSAREFEPEFHNDTEDFLDEAVSKL